MNRRTKPETGASGGAEAIEAALCRSILCGALSLALHAPTSKTITVFSSAQTAKMIGSAVSLLDSIGACDRGGTGGEGPPCLADCSQAWTGTFADLNLDSLLGNYNRLFGHAARGTVCPYETEYGQDGLFQQPQQMANLTGFYEAFGLRVNRSEHERPDHISCELEFMGFLMHKRAYSLESENESMLEATSRAERLFLAGHLGRFGRAFGGQLREHDDHGFLGRAADLLINYLTVECRRLELPLGPMRLPLQPPAEDQVPMACASEPDLVPLEN